MQVAFNFNEDVYYKMRGNKFQVSLGCSPGKAIAEMIPCYRWHCMVLPTEEPTKSYAQEQMGEVHKMYDSMLRSIRRDR
jgi:hypothetical protein